MTWVTWQQYRYQAALSAALYTVRPKEGYFKESDAGAISIGNDGRTTLTPSADGKHRFLIADPAQKERIVPLFVETASTKPVPRAQVQRSVSRPAAATCSPIGCQDFFAAKRVASKRKRPWASWHNTALATAAG